MSSQTTKVKVTCDKCGKSLTQSYLKTHLKKACLVTKKAREEQEKEENVRRHKVQKEREAQHKARQAACDKEFETMAAQYPIFMSLFKKMYQLYQRWKHVDPDDMLTRDNVEEKNQNSY